MKSMNQQTRLILFVSFCMVALATQAFGFAAVPVGDIGYEFYDMAKKMSEGAIGSTIGLGGLSLAAFFLFKQQVMPAVGTAMGAMAIAKSGPLLTSMGGTF